MSTAAILASVRAIEARRRLQRPGSPAELASALDPKFVVTPTIRLLSDIAVRLVTEPDQRDIVDTPPRTGKSQLLVVWTIVWALMMDPDLEIIVTAYGDDLAEEHSRKARAIITEHSAYLGYELSGDKTAVKRWTVLGRKGGVRAGGIQSGITGLGCSLLLVDDPLKSQADADSATVRNRILGEYQSTLSTRVHPGGSTLVVMTRWHEEDLAGALLAQEPDVWRHTNIPAISEAGVPDALRRRRSGVAMTSALGYTLKDYESRRRTAGSRAWYALYMGVPSAPEGGLVKAAWLDGWRLPARPERPVLTIVGVDPSDSGKGDSCGLVACDITADGVSTLIADQSKPMTSDEWARAAVKLAVDVGASEIAVEGFAARETYTRVVKEAIARAKVNRPIRVTSWPPKGRPRVGDAIARSSALLQAMEVGTFRLAGHFPDFEERAVQWQSGQHQPDNLAAAVVAHDVLVHAAGAEWQIATGIPEKPGLGAPGQIAPVASLDWMRQRVG